MRLSLTREQQDMQSILRGFLRARYGSVPQPLSPNAPSYDTDVWTEMTDGLGLAVAGMPSPDGVAEGNSVRDLVVVLEELGRVVDGSPYFPSVVLAAGVLAASHDPRVAHALDAIAEGSRIAAFVEDSSLTADVDNGEWAINGSARVWHGSAADVLVVKAGTPLGDSLFLLDGPQPSRTALTVLDLTMPYADVDLARHPATPLGTPGTAAEVVRTATPRWLVALAALQVGNAALALDMTTEHASSRSQFNRPIGSFQSVKHELVDVMMAVESGRAAVTHAATALDAGASDAEVLAHHALAVAGDANLHAAKTCVQIHGAMGFTWEHPAHVLLKRAMSTRHLLGGPDVHRERVAAALLDVD